MKATNLNDAKIKNILNDFTKKNPVAGNRSKMKWQMKHPSEYAAAKILFKKGYTLTQIAKYFKVSDVTIRASFLRDNVFKPRKYNKSSKR